MKLNGISSKTDKQEDHELEEANGNSMEEAINEEQPVPLIATCFGSGMRNVNLAIR